VSTAEKNLGVAAGRRMKQKRMKQESAGRVITSSRRIFAAVAGVILIWGITFTAVYLVWTRSLFNRLTGLSIAMALVGAFGLFKALRPSQKGLD
jgi:hypothetical protein